MMDNSGPSSTPTKAAELFEDLWKQLGDCHKTAIHELEEKVTKLRKERCLDAQRLEVFYKRNQQLKEQITSLQEAVGALEDRLRAGECDQCAVLEGNLKNSQDQNQRVIAKLKQERSCLEDENRKLHADLKKLRMSCSELEQTSPPQGQEEGIIPDSPLLPSSLPVANKLKKRKQTDKHVRYAERSVLQPNNSLFNEMNKDPFDENNSERAEMLVPDTCALEGSQTIMDVNTQDVVAETCGFELIRKPSRKPGTMGNKQSNASPSKCGDRLKLIHSPDLTTERSPSLLTHVKRSAAESSLCKAKRKKEESEPAEQQEMEADRGVSRNKSNQSLHESSDRKVQAEQKGSLSNALDASCTSPAFKIPTRTFNVRAKQNVSCRQPDADESQRKHKPEPVWSMDPALALSMYDSERMEEDEQKEEHGHGDFEDTDRTWVSHSMLQRCRGDEGDGEDGMDGIGAKANDSLDQMFDTTACGEYQSGISSQLGQSQPCEDEEEENDDGFRQSTQVDNNVDKAGRPNFAHLAVIRKKDERRKLKGTTCKECEIYYAHLPEEEKKKKLSACSRHRFLYVPPCTPENFWEVGFPSTQTCVERGYIKEETNPQARSRRRQPLNALFTPKLNLQESLLD